VVTISCDDGVPERWLAASIAVVGICDEAEDDDDEPAMFSIGYGEAQM
jgi:hypothetical protein